MDRQCTMDVTLPRWFDTRFPSAVISLLWKARFSCACGPSARTDTEAGASCYINSGRENRCVGGA